MTAANNRLWPSAILAWLAMVLTIVGAARAGWLGIALVLPALAVIAVAAKLIGWHMHGPIPVTGIVVLAIGGLVFGITTPNSRTK